MPKIKKGSTTKKGKPAARKKTVKVDPDLASNIGAADPPKGGPVSTPDLSIPGVNDLAAADKLKTGPKGEKGGQVKAATAAAPPPGILAVPDPNFLFLLNAVNGFFHVRAPKWALSVSETDQFARVLPPVIEKYFPGFSQHSPEVGLGSALVAYIATRVDLSGLPMFSGLPGVPPPDPGPVSDPGPVWDPGPSATPPENSVLNIPTVENGDEKK